MTISVGGATGTKTFDTTTTTDASMGWKAGKLTFTGTAGQTVTVTFTDTDTGTPYGMVIDAVSMTAS